MSTPRRGSGPAATARLALGSLTDATAADPAAAVVLADPVLDGELVEPARPAAVALWWRHSPRVPTALKSWRHARQAAKDAVVAVLRSPWRFVGAVARGAVAAARAWRRWVSVRDFRNAAEQAEKLADKFTEIRALALFRWKVTAAVLAAAIMGVLVAHVVIGDRPLWIAAVALPLVLAVLGRRKDGSPGRRPVLAGPRTLTWTMDPQVLVDAFRDAKLIGKDEALRLVERATRVGDGWAVTVDLPATRKAADVVKNRDDLASALAVDELQLVVERVRGNGGHAGRIALWVADDDPYSRPPTRTPLLNARFWDAWRPVPFGLDARGRRIDLPLVWTSLLIGAIPRQGKTFAARLAAAGLVLDPHTRLYVADFKAGKDWDAAAQVAHRFMSGDDTEHVLTLAAWLAELVAEVQGRYSRMRELDDRRCPESKLTPELSRDRDLDMPVTAIVVDEVQVPLGDRTPVEVHGRQVPAGEHIGELLTWLAKKGPAAGVVLLLATQRPDSQTIPSGLRAVMGSRFALRVMDWRDSNIVLGEQMNTRGYDSSRLLPTHKGVGILRPDGDVAAELAVTVRTYYMPNEDWRLICERGRELRRTADTLTGHAAGDRTIPTLSVIPAPLAPAPTVPEPLASVVAYLGDELDSRDFVPTAELLDALGMERTTFARQMSDLGCRPRPGRITTEDGARQVRGYRTADLRAAAEELSS
ncbi:MAG TPA: cell division protein FtsK [Pseudonocardiaceae bacterium]